MAFAVDQGCKPSVIGCFFGEHDPAKTTFRNTSWSSGKPSIDNDVPVQGFLVQSASERRYSGIDYGLQLTSDSSNVPHWMNSEQVLSLQGNSGGDKTPDVAPCTPVPSFSRPKVQKCEMSAPNSDYPSLCLSIGSPSKRPYQSVEMRSGNEQKSALKAHCQLITVNSPRSLSSKAPQKEHAPYADPSREELLSLLLYKHQKGDQVSTTLSSQRFSPLSSHAAAIPFLENFTSNEMQSTTSVGQTDVDHHKLLLETNYRSLNSSACKMANEGSLGNLFSGNSRGLVESSPSSAAMLSTPVSKKGTQEKSVLLDCSVTNSQNMDISRFSKVSPAKRVADGPPSLIKDGRAFKPHILSDFFVQTEMDFSSNTDSRCQNIENRKHPEKKSRIFSSHDSMYPGSSKEYGSPLNGILGSVKDSKSNQQNTESISLHSNGTNTPKVKLEIHLEDKVCKNISAQVPVNTSTLSSHNVVVSATERSSSNVQADSSNVMDPLNSSTPIRSYSYNSTPRNSPKASHRDQYEETQKTSSLIRNVSANGDSKSSSVNGDWGKFLALSAVPEQHSNKQKSEIVLPFQLRFQKLQEFLKKCDQSDKKYCLEAVRCLTALERNDQAGALEARAVKLSVEEGKELRRMKLLNILSKSTEVSNLGAYLVTPNGPKLPAPGTIVQVKQESQH